MSVFFLYPLYLFGLLAASLPILIHLLNRRRMKRIRFPAMRFILLSQKRISRSYRIRHWLVLALRTLAVMLLVLLLANPIFQTGAGLFAGGGPVSLVILLDNSMSMTWSGDGNGFAQAKEAARLLITALNNGDRATLIPTNISGKEDFRLKEEKEVLLRDLQAIEIADGTANFNVALDRAYQLLNAPAGDKEIRLITDLGLTGWDQFSVAALKQYDPSIPLKTIHVSPQQKPLNGAVKEIKLGGNGVGVNLPLQIEAVLANFGAVEIKELLVQLSIDGEAREQKLATIPPLGETSVKFQSKLVKPGDHRGEITLKKEGFAGNPRNHFALTAQDKLNVLVVDGDPQTALVRSETFFLSRALNPAGDQHTSLYLPTVIIAEGLGAASLEAYQVVILCNVATLTDAAAQRLRNYLSQGGGLMVFVGDRLQMDNYNRQLAQGLPTRLTEKKLAPEAAAVGIGKVDLTHPALQQLNDPILQESLAGARVWGYFRGDGAGKSALISLASGDPLVAEQKSGAGRVIFVATSADRDWNDLPVKTVYLPLIQGLTNYLAGSKRGSLDGGVAVGGIKEISLPASVVGKNLRITKPNKQETEIGIIAHKDRSVANFDDNDRAGIYRVSPPAGAEKEGAVTSLYAVNSPFLESRLDEINERELQAKLRPIQVEVIPMEALREGGTRMDLALPLMVLLIVILLFEGWLAQRF
ncbi:MAG: BatA domain-containing protein [Deltaproteobacteria bacterium]|nr:BatA domain-containing protein [Deltaproteobacteria bacterium]